MNEWVTDEVVCKYVVNPAITGRNYRERERELRETRRMHERESKARKRDSAGREQQQQQQRQQERSKQVGDGRQVRGDHDDRSGTLSSSDEALVNADLTMD